MIRVVVLGVLTEMPLGAMETPEKRLQSTEK